MNILRDLADEVGMSAFMWALGIMKLPETLREVKHIIYSYPRPNRE